MTEPTRIPDMMMTGIPAYITRIQVMELIESLGIDPHKIRRVEIDPNSVTVEVMAKNLDGTPLSIRPNESAIHRMYVPIVDKDPYS